MLAIAMFAIGSTNLWAYSGGSGTSSSPYLIANKADLLQLAGNTNHYNKYFKMTADIDLAGESFSKAVIAPDTSTESGFQGTEFTGTFDGNGHVIRNLKILGRNDYCALFGRIGDTQNFGTVKNLGVVNCNITSGINYAGGLCGDLASGTIDNCYSTGTIEPDQSKYVAGYGTYIGGLCGNIGSKSTISNCYSSCTVNGAYKAGGLCGNNEGTISNSYSTGSVKYSSAVGGCGGRNGEENGDYFLGGICGSNSGNIKNCYSIGNVNGDCYLGGFCGSNSANINDCYSIGSVTGYKYLGGFCGQNSGIISSSFWDVSTSGLMSSDGGTGVVTDQLKDKTAFTAANWNFVDTWVMDGYPVLKMCKKEKELFAE
jgi:hypothetical protein